MNVLTVDTRLNDVSNILVSKENKFNSNQTETKQENFNSTYKIEPFDCLENFDFYDCFGNFVYSPPEEFDNFTHYYYNDDKTLIE